MDNKRKPPRRYTQPVKRQKLEPQEEQKEKEEGKEQKEKKEKKQVIVIIPPIFMLNIDCLNEIFDWLSQHDVISFSQVCKWAQRVAGNYFQKNYPMAVFDVVDFPKMYPNFIQFYNNIKLSYDSFRWLQNVKSIENPSFKRIHLDRCGLTSFNCIKPFLKTVESMRFEGCDVKYNGKFTEHFLTFCPNLKRLYMHITVYYSDFSLLSDFLLQKYPTLEHLELHFSYTPEIKQLKTFFERNPNVRSFAIEIDRLMENKNVLMATDAKLDTLSVFDSKSFERRNKFASVCSVLNNLYERGFYQRLHLYDKLGSLTQFASLRGLEKLRMSERVCVELPDFSALINVKELKLGWFSMDKEHKLEELAKRLSILEKLCIDHCELKLQLNITLTFIRHSTKLREIRLISDSKEIKQPISDLQKWQKEREKLNGATKVAIYVQEETYLATKWAMDTTNFPLIELKRVKSFERRNDVGRDLEIYGIGFY